MGILYLVGAGLEQPSIVTSLLNVDDGSEQPREGETMEVVHCKPVYYMADALPLLLWECGYKENDVNWMTDDGKNEKSAKVEAEQRGFDRTFNVYQELYFLHERSILRSTMDTHFLATAAKYHAAASSLYAARPVSDADPNIFSNEIPGRKMRIPLGAGTFTRTGQYTPVLRRKRLEDIMIVNKRWAEGQGVRRDEKKKQGLLDEGDE